MKIVDTNNKEIKAAFQFVQGNCLISVSTILDKHGNIAIFDKYTNELLKAHRGSLQAAIGWVAMYGPRD